MHATHAYMHEQLNWDDLRFFLAAAQHGGFGAAARRINQQQSTVSRRVATLEAQLGAIVFDRTATGLRLTSLGRKVLTEAQVMAAALTRVGDAASATKSVVEGVVRLALTETLAAVFVIPEVLPALLKQHPKLRLDLVISEASADLGRREADIAVRFFLMPSGDLLTKRVARLRTAVLGSQKLAKTLAHKPLTAWPFVSAWLATGTAPEDEWREQVAKGEVRVSTNSFHAQVEAVRAGLGVAVLPDILCAPLKLAPIRLPVGVPAPPNIDMYLVTPRALRKVPRIAAVFDALSASFSALR